MTLHNIPLEDSIPLHIKAAAVRFHASFENRTLLYKDGTLWSQVVQGEWTPMRAGYDYPEYPGTGSWLIDQANINNIRPYPLDLVQEWASRFKPEMLIVE